VDPGGGEWGGEGSGGRAGGRGKVAAEIGAGSEGAVVVAGEAGLVAAGEGEGVGFVGEVPEGAGATFALAGRPVAGAGLLLDFVIEEGGFDAGVAAEAPLGGDGLLDEVDFNGVGGLETEELGLAQSPETIGVLDGYPNRSNLGIRRTLARVE
jgi:hypothetical protein